MNNREERVCKIYLITIITMLVGVYVLLMTGTVLAYASYSNEEIQPKVVRTINDAVHKSTTFKSKDLIDNVERFKQPEPIVEVVEEVRMEVNDDELYLLAKIIFAEAGNQPYEGMVAVGNVVLNRVESSNFPNTIKRVIYQKGQFSPVSNGSINKKPSSKAIEAAREVLKGTQVVDSGVMFFYNPDISTSRWIFTRKVVFKVGDHVFAI